MSYPETEKLIRLSELFDCTLDYLLKDNVERESTTKTADVSEAVIQISAENLFKKFTCFEKKSKRTVFGMPLWHIGKNAKGFVAIGIKAQGVISLGLFSIGIVSFGFLSIGLLALGLFAIGGLAGGCFALGGMSFGSIAVGIVSFGAIAIGEFSCGALSIGHYFAYGDYASAMFAFGDTNATGTVFETLKDLSSAEKQAVTESMYQKIPAIYHGIVKWLSSLL